jgi:hypothetical protein
MVTIIETCWKCGTVHYVGLGSEQHRMHLCRKCYEETPEYELSVKNFLKANEEKGDAG